MSLGLARRAVLTDMAYEIGGGGLAGFPRLLAACRAGDWEQAAAEVENSLLYSQVPGRERENCRVLISGLLPPPLDSAEALIKRHEGLVLTARPDAKGKWEIGYGHDIQGLPPGSLLTCTLAEADAWFEADLDLAVLRASTALGLEHW